MENKSQKDKENQESRPLPFYQKDQETARRLVGVSKIFFHQRRLGIDRKCLA